MTIFVFCLLVSTVSVWKTCAFASLAALLLSVAGCFAPKSWFRRRRRGATSSELVVVTVTAGAARPGNPCAHAQVNAPPAFAFQCPLEAAGGGGEAAAAAVSCVVCSVCLEDVRGGGMVRQVPVCRHIFHVGCIDMWLHSHRTCPMCRCEISPALEKVTPKDAVEEAPVSSDDQELPPV
ncbi:hypothetical protein BAE44_0016836 [Dichanthelium oligosanthes]|uniref:RING-type E3 ubiquitin transferase n=1 Tax=Dichanthelium oligosanthes TaxID=888268 RepID=A0A1E5VAU6_9POAL|nr:hypothetical protein BAE44_0016836 [Dichanthelium oligosanthes]